MSTISIIIIAVLIGVIIWIYKIASGILGPWRPQNKWNREEHEKKIICIAAPILSPQGRVLGGLSVTSTTLRHRLDGLTVFKSDILRTADLIGKDAEVWHFPEQQTTAPSQGN